MRKNPCSFLVANVIRDLQGFNSSNKALHPSRTFTHHTAIVNDVQFHPKHGSLIGTVSDDLTLQVLDTRSKDDKQASLKAEDGHADAINAVAFNPVSEFILATGSADKSIGIWDLRSLKNKVHACTGHQDSVTSLEWHPFEESVLGSASYDRRLIFWDLSKVGQEQTPEDAEDGAPEVYVQSPLAGIGTFSHFASPHILRPPRTYPHLLSNLSTSTDHPILDYLCMAAIPIASRTFRGT